MDVVLLKVVISCPMNQPFHPPKPFVSSTVVKVEVDREDSGQ